MTDRAYEGVFSAKAHAKIRLLIANNPQNCCFILERSSKLNLEINQPSDFKPESFLEYTKLKADGGLKQDSFKPDHLENMRLYEESNEKWLKSSIATFNGKGPDISYEDVDTSLIQPRPRKYD